eukprot:365806-Chlamydomonas_euryale.AAC.7
MDALQKQTFWGASHSEKWSTSLKHSFDLRNRYATLPCQEMHMLLICPCSLTRRIRHGSEWRLLCDGARHATSAFGLLASFRRRMHGGLLPATSLVVRSGGLLPATSVTLVGCSLQHL